MASVRPCFLGWAGQEVWRCSLTVSKPVLKAPVVSALETKLTYDETLLKFAFNVSVRRYKEGVGPGGAPRGWQGLTFIL